VRNSNLLHLLGTLRERFFMLDALMEKLEFILLLLKEVVDFDNKFI